jgi:L-ribulose-5-phosphate 3-epimerase
LNFMQSPFNRRQFLQRASLMTAGVAVAGKHSLISGTAQGTDKIGKREIGVHPFSLKPLFQSQQITIESYPEFVRKKLDLDFIEYDVGDCARLFENPSRTGTIRKYAKDAGIGIMTLLCADNPGLDADSKQERKEAVESHRRWMEVAAGLGCRFIRLRAGAPGDPDSRLKKATEGFGQLLDATQGSPVTPLIENVGGLSRDPDWLIKLRGQIGSNRIALLGDFGNFEGDYYQGMLKLLPHCKAFCSKSWDFDPQGNDTKIDFQRMMKVLQKSSFREPIAIEYLGKNTPPVEGIRKTALLLAKGDSISDA